MQPLPEELCAKMFEPLVGQKFTMVDGPSETVLELVAVDERPERKSGPEFRIPFYLEFRAQPHRPKPDRIYRLKNETLGDLDLFLAPLRRTADGCWYVATFN